MHRLNLRSWQPVVLLWLFWALVMNGFQVFLVRRLALVQPDPVLRWTAAYTSQSFLDSLAAKGDHWQLYADPHAAWDSNYYLSIAAAGYDDPLMPTVRVASGAELSLNYAFMPLYPWLIRIFNTPLQVFLSPQLALLWAGVFVSLLGTLAGMLALGAIVGNRTLASPALPGNAAPLPAQGGGDGKDRLAGDGIRAAFYLLIFPSGFFLFQVYTEGLFIGLAFGCLALIARRQWPGAALLATAAFFTRATGLGLLLALAVALVHESGPAWRRGEYRSWSFLGRLACLCLPVAALLIWQASPLGAKYFAVQESYFNRYTFALSESWVNWSRAVSAWLGGELPAIRQTYFSLEFASVILAAVASLAILRHDPPVAFFSLFVVLTSVMSGYPQSIIRYMLSVPAIYLWLASLGRRPLFDRAWTLASTLLMGALLALFTFDLWVG